MDNSRIQTIGIGVLVFVVGLVIGCTYAGGAYPPEWNNRFQEIYVESIAESYTVNHDIVEASARLGAFNNVEKVRLLAIANNHVGSIDPGRADAIAQFAVALRVQEGWTDDEVIAGLSTGNASSGFSDVLGFGIETEPTEPGVEPVVPVEPGEASPSFWQRWGKVITYIALFFVLVIIAAVVLLVLSRIRPKHQPRWKKPDVEEEIDEETGVELTPLRQWSGTYTLGSDYYDESFALETEEGDFLGEAGMGILDDFSSGSSPKRVLAMDVWIFDKTDVKTISTPVMSEFTYNDELFREKINPESTPILAQEGFEFEVKASALFMKGTIDEVVYGEEAPPNSYFESIKVTLTAYLNPTVDISGTMDLPDHMKSANVTPPEI